MIDLKLKTLADGSHDLDVTNFDLGTVDEIDAVRQSLAIRLQFFFGEWFLDTTKGVKLYDFVLIKNPDPNLIASVMKVVILETNDVVNLLEYTQEIDNKTRKLSITFKVDTVFGELGTTQTIGP